jgi:predicted nuclease of predicted toxin-antitoxin system
MDRASDTEVWRYAAEHGFTIVSKDSDFHQRSLLFGSPPKVVWLRIGNCSVAESATALRERYIPLRRFVEESTADFLVVS